MNILGLVFLLLEVKTQRTKKERIREVAIVALDELIDVTIATGDIRRVIEGAKHARETGDWSEFDTAIERGVERAALRGGADGVR